VATDRVKKYKTGGGTYTSMMDAVDEKVVSLLGHRATPLMNPYDSSAAYCTDCELATVVDQFMTAHVKQCQRVI